jgi:hypothetical protein
MGGESFLKAFLIDYCQRHAHPLNAILHFIGVPAAFFGFYLVATGKFYSGIVAIVIGYFLQYLGHKAQGNEVGEVTLIKAIVRGAKSRLSKSNV